MEFPIGLSKSETSFLKTHNIRPNQVFDAKGISRTEYSKLMKANNQIIAFNTTPCSAAGHRLRTRSGHCAICNTAAIGFQKRNDNFGFVYIAESKAEQLIKIGFTNDYQNRQYHLNYQKYGGIEDWEVLLVLKSDQAGKLESKLHSTLGIYATTGEYFHDQHVQQGKELFRCSLAKVRETLKTLDFQFNIILEKKQES